VEDMLQDLAQHLAYHASVGFAECRDMDPPLEPTAEHSGRTDGHDMEFIVEHAGRKFTVTIEEIV
jgi:hypothetical protein